MRAPVIPELGNYRAGTATRLSLLVSLNLRNRLKTPLPGHARHILTRDCGDSLLKLRSRDFAPN